MRGLLLCVVCLAQAACVEVPEVPMVGDLAADGGAQRDGGYVPFDAGPPPVDQSPPVVRITSPLAAASFPSSMAVIVVEGTAQDDVGVAAVTVSVGPNAAVPAATTDFFRTWHVTAALPAGPQRIRAVVTDVNGKTSDASLTVTRAPATTDAAPPQLTITTPLAGARTTSASLLVLGTAHDDTGVAKVEARVVGVSEYTVVETSDAYANWRTQVGLAPGASNRVRVRATDLVGNTVEQEVLVTSITAADREPPKLMVLEPIDGANLTVGTVLVRGTATDNVGMAKVEVAGEDGVYVQAASTDGFAAWSRTVSLVTGANHLHVRATDLSDLETVVTVTVSTTFRPEYGPLRSYELRLAAPRDRNVALVLNKAGLGEVIPESVRRSIKILDLDPTTLMTSTMETIKNACGSGWQVATFTPHCPSAWGQAEVNLWRLLTMTSGNVNVDGTSIAGTRDIASTLATFGLIDDFSTILAETLGLAKTAEIVDTATAVAALKDDLIKTHPNASPDGTLPVTIQDGYTDMRELATKFGPAARPSGAPHPGFLDPASPTVSVVMTDQFLMSVNGVSNLTWYDGVDLSQGKDYLARLPSPTSDVITFDFANTMTVSGLAANPTVSLTFVMREDPRFLASAVLENDQDAPPHPGNGQAWTTDKWLIEYVLVDASYRKYRTRAAYEHLYEAPLVGTDEALIAVGKNSNVNDIFGSPRIPHIPNPRAGWARFWTLFGLGSPPKAQYLWDMIAEISQIRLRDGGVLEGQGSTKFKLAGLPVGLTGAQIVAQMRPAMEAQKSVLAQRLLGDYRTNNGAVDFYLAGTAGNLYLYFSHASDPLPRPVTYATPGFFSDSALTQKVSTTAAGTSGDSVHEKLALGATARTVYAKDDAGDVYKLELDAAQSDRVTLRVSKKVQ